MIVENSPWVTDPECLIPDLLQKHPEARQVLDRHGLKGCGGPMGPYETLRFFARAHGVDEAGLLREIDQAIAHPEVIEAEPEVESSVADAIYRPFFLAGIAVVLTAGATWGAWILWNIGLTGSFTGGSVHQVNAHGEAQIYGWVGLFIMGFASQAFPRMWQTRLAAPGLALVAFALMLLGIILKTVGMTATGVYTGATELAMLGGVLQIVASTVFSAQIVVTLRRSGLRLDPSLALILASLACFVLSCVYSTWHTWNTMTAASPPALVEAVATYQLPLRDLQVHGMALFMILGVSLRILSGMFNAPRVGLRRAWWAFGLLMAALVSEIVFYLTYRWTGNATWTAGLFASWLAMSVGIALIVLPWKLWKPLPESDRSGKFVRMSYLWLGIAMTMLLLMPLYHAAADVPFSHAYFGAVRHAITVGFVSLMIMGVAAKVVPTLNGIDPSTLGSLWGPFLLVNLGCSLRVSLQTLTDWTHHAYPLIGVSGTLEVIGLTWWGLGLVSILLFAPRAGAKPATSNLPRPSRIEGSHRVADILSWYPNAERVLLKHGFTSLQNPLMRRTVARQVTIEQAARLRGVDLGPLLEALNRQGTLPSLTVLSSPKPAGMGHGHNHNHSHDHGHDHGHDHCHGS